MNIKTYSPDDGITTICSIEYKGQTFLGIAKCADVDLDMKATLTGATIAETRAFVALNKYIRDYELKPKLKALKQLYYTMRQSPKFDENSYENKILQRKIRSLQNGLTTTKEIIATDRRILKEFIDSKEELYQKLRNNRKKVKSN